MIGFACSVKPPKTQKALPAHMNADRMARIALTTIRTNPKLLQCNVESLMASVMQAAQLGLEPSLLGHCYIIPYGSEAQFIIGYRGMIDLARRSGNIQSIVVHEVYQNDYFKLSYGLEDTLQHIPYHLRTDEKATEPGSLRGCYMVAKFKDGGYQVHYLSKDEIDQHRKRSKASGNGPWVTDYVEMCKKTVIRAAWKWLPLSVEVMRQVEATDETVKKDIADDMTDVVDIAGEYKVEDVEEESKKEEQAGNDAGQVNFEGTPLA
jgi:recombination protein RecT